MMKIRSFILWVALAFAFAACGLPQPSKPEDQKRLLDAAKQREAAQAELNSAYRVLSELKRAPTPDQAKITEQQGNLNDLVGKLEAAQISESAALKVLNDAQSLSASDFNSGRTVVSFVIIAGTLALLLGLIWFGSVLWKASGNAASEAGNDSIARVRLAKTVTIGAMGFIVFVAVVTLYFAGVNAILDPDEKKTNLFFEMAKWVMGTVLPVVGAWVGGVLAFYFGKDNLKTGADVARETAKQVISAQQRLQGVLAGTQGLDLKDNGVKKHEFKGELSAEKLIDIEASAGGKQRVPLVDPQGIVHGCLHLSYISMYRDGLKEAERKDPRHQTLGALMAKKPWVPANSFATVRSSDDLNVVKSLFSAECNDVFVTADGTKARPALRWITDKDVSKIEDGAAQ